MRPALWKPQETEKHKRVMCTHKERVQAAVSDSGVKPGPPQPGGLGEVCNAPWRRERMMSQVPAGLLAIKQAPGETACLAAVTQARATEDTSCSSQGNLSQILSLSRQVPLNPSALKAARKCPRPGRRGHFTTSNGNLHPSQSAVSHRLFWVLEASRQL